MEGSTSSSRRDNVVLPAPEGDDNTSIRPRRATVSPSSCAIPLLQILHLFAELLDHALQLKADIGQFQVIGFGAEGIRFAVEFLGEKIKAPPDWSALVQQGARLGDMRHEPVELLADVGPGGEQHSFLMQAVGIEPV